MGGDPIMLVLTFHVDGIVYAVPVKQVIEVVPRVALRAVPHSASCFLGLLHYRGSALPVIDLGLLMGRAACVDRLDTRILLVRTSIGDQRLGLLAERVNELVELDAAKMAMQGPFVRNAPYLAEVYETEAGLLQLIDPTRISAGSVAALEGIVTP